DGRLTHRDDLSHELFGVVVDEELQESAVPVVRDRRLHWSRRDLHGAGPEPEDRLARFHPTRVLDLVKTGLEEGPTYVDPDNEPDKCHPRVGEEEARDRRVRDHGRAADACV